MKLNRKTLLIYVLALTALHVPAAAQKEDKRPQGEEVSTPVRGGKAAPRMRVPVRIPVESVAAESAADLVNTVLAMQRNPHRCSGCKEQERLDGSCEDCLAEREKFPADPVMERVELSVDRRFLSVTVKPHNWGSLNEFVGMLERLEARVKRPAFRIPDHARILVTGVADEKAAKRMCYALKDLKVLQSATTVPGPEKDAVWVLPRMPEEGATVGAIEAALSKMRGEYTVSDVQWAAYCATCGAQSTFDMGNAICRAD